jgi:uncharacterized protein YozE (UPF0346 family)
MTNFTLKDTDNIFLRLTREFHELVEYLTEQETDDLNLTTIVLDGCAQFLAKNHENEKLLNKTLLYIESVITESHKAEEVKITIFESLYSQYLDILDEVKNKFKKNTKTLFEEWFKSDRIRLFGN